METKKSLTPIYELELSDGISLKIHVKKAKKGILSIILFFALSIFFIPIIVCIYLATTSEGIPFGFIITCTVGFLSSGYLLKLYLWDKYGTEVFIIKKKNLVLYYDYKLFKDNYKKIPFESICTFSERICTVFASINTGIVIITTLMEQYVKKSSYISSVYSGSEEI